MASVGQGLSMTAGTLEIIQNEMVNSSMCIIGKNKPKAKNEKKRVCLAAGLPNQRVAMAAACDEQWH